MDLFTTDLTNAKAEAKKAADEAAARLAEKQAEAQKIAEEAKKKAEEAAAIAAEAKERVIKQGDPGDFLFVIESGKLDCIIQVEGADKVVKTCEAGDVFGEHHAGADAPAR